MIERKKIILSGLIFFAIITAGIKTASAQPPCDHRLPTWWELFTKSAQQVDIKGKIVAISFPVATIKTRNGEYYIVRLGPWWYWKEKGYTLNKGDLVKITGFRYNDLVFPREIQTPRGKISLRDGNGQPLWRKFRHRKGLGHRRWNHHNDWR